MSKVGSLEEVLDNTEVVDYFENNKCSECGNCCTRYLALSNKEINTIKAYIERNNIERQFHSVNVIASKMFDMTCPFLDDNSPTHKCTIYEIRPLICREFTCRGYREGFKPSAEMYKVPRHKVDVTEIFFGKGEET